MTLCPEANRLRRIARACAAGEISRRDYRRTRRDVIKQLQGEPQTGDLTERRGIGEGETTQRRAPREFARYAPDSGQARKPWGWLLAGVFLTLLLALPVLVLAAGAAPQTIPSAADRHPDPALSRKVLLDGVTLPLAEPLPGVPEAELQAFLDAALADAQAHNAVRSDGFTRAELEQVGRFLNAVGVHDADTPLTRQDLDDLAALVQRQKSQRGVSVAQLENIAARAQAWLRARGYPLARTYLPAQTVTAGEVVLGVEVGRLSAVRLAGEGAAPDESTAALARRYGLDDLLGRPVRRDVLETRLNVLNNLGSRPLQAGFEPGEAVGDSRMVLHLGEEQPLRAFAQVDNHGTRPDAEERVSAGAAFADLLRGGDTLSVHLTAEPDSPSQLFGVVSYLQPVRTGRMHLASTVAHTRLTDAQGRDGEGWLVEVMLDDTRLFTRQTKRQWRYGAGWHDVDVLSDGVDGEERVFFGHAQLDWHRLWDSARVSVEGSVDFRVGQARRDSASEHIWRVRAQATAWTPVRLPLLGTQAKWIVAPRVQTGTRELPATFALSASDPAEGAGLPAGSLLLDEGGAVASALRFKAPRGEWWVYGEYVYGEVGRLRQWYQLTTFGVGWEARFGSALAGGLRSRVTLGYPVAHKSDGVFDDDGLQLFWSLRYEH